ncbi:MAG TPA: response regulator transcription factor [Thermoanaerobaculia bacterium]|nr:response regulator transcription factor [Thermoanaerobaculia bacterium]
MLPALRVLVVDDHQLFRQCLSTALGKRGAAEVRVAESAEEALATLDGWPPDVLLVGLDGGGAGALGLTRQVAARFGGVRVIVLGSQEVAREMAACLEVGARGSVFREQSLDELEAAIAAVAAGEIVCAPGVAHALFSRLGELGLERRRRERLEFLDLTPRELEILHLIAENLSNQEIAERLFLSVHTVKNHVHNMIERLGVENRSEAVRHAYHRGWFRDRRGPRQGL